ncbi:MAG: hypothetical protein ICV85_07020, partial [Tolypothrix sp. T3-bin4]|nr:hypothetical protein [Tolypothrix sp. T3-bin4]
KWQNGKLHFQQNEEIKARQFRAKEVCEKYAHRLLENEVVFFPDSDRSLTVKLGEESCACQCADILNRRLPCKHIFAGAFLLGDKDVLVDIPPPTAVTNASQKRKRKLRPQDIKVGKYFTLLDFLISDTACKHGIPNFVDWETEAGQKAISLMQMLCTNILDPLCEEFNRVSITRGYLGLELFKHIYRATGETWPEAALAHGFSTSAGCDIWVHAWSGEALDLALYLQKSSSYNFDFIRVYPQSPILCVGINAVKQKRIIQEWMPDFRGSKIHKPDFYNSRTGLVGEHRLF